MPTSNDEAAQELEQLRAERDISMAWIARKVARNPMWVSRKLAGKVPITIDEYNLLRNVIETVAPKELVFK